MTLARALAAAVVFVLSAAQLTRDTRVAILHTDEPRMLNRGFLAGELYADYLRTGTLAPGWESEVWQARKPPLGNLIIALGLRLGDATPPPAPYQYDWLKDYRWNAEHGQVPSAEVLQAGRRLVPLFGGAATAAVFLLGAAGGGIPGGLLAAFVFHRNPVVRMYGCRALADIPMLAFSLWAFWYLVRRVAPAWDERRRLAARVLVLGLLVGLAAATKQNGALVACAALVIFVAWALESARRIGGREAALRAGLAGLLLVGVSYAFYVVVNPQLHAAPLSRTAAQVEAWNRKFTGHWKARPEKALRTPGARLAAVARVMGGFEFPALPSPLLTIALLVGGTLSLAAGGHLVERARAPAALLLLWSALTVVGVTLWIPLDWDRYYLPVIAVAAVLSAAISRRVPLPRWAAGDP